MTDDEAPEALRQVLTRGLAKAPDDRYQQCVDMRAELELVRRSIIASTARVVQAARDRYQQILGLIEERRALGRSLAIADIDRSCDDALAGIEARFQAFADAEAPPVFMDRAVANAGLEALQGRYNAEQAAIAALHERAAEALRPPDPASRTRSSFWRGLLKARGN